MHAALIPPVRDLDAIKRQKFHLVLPQLLDLSVEYYDYYVDLETKNRHIILDNGAYEGWDYTKEQIHRLGKEIGADELVVPDVMGKQRESLELLRHFEPVEGFQYMAVLQGRTAEEICEYIEELDPNQFPWLTTIGIPRHLIGTLITSWHLHARLKAASIIRQKYGDRYQIHFLGASPLWYFEIAEAAATGFIRSVDTSAPFYLAMNNVRLSSSTDSKVDRPVRYFERKLDSKQLVLAKANVDTIREWCNES